MDWFRSRQKSSSNELGDYLPDGGEQQYEQSERIQAPTRKIAEKECDAIATTYGGTEPNVERVDKGLFDCKFKLWG